MNVVRNVTAGVEFTFDPKDFKVMDWQEFIAEIKRIPGWQYDSEFKVWSLPESGVQRFYQLKKQYLDDIVNKNQIDLFGDEL